MEEKKLQKTTADRIEEFVQKRDRLMTMGGEAMVRKQKEQGKWTARERLDFLFDKGTFQEVQLFVKHRSALFGLAGKEINADGVVTGFGQVNGRVVFAAAQDFTSAGGSLGEMHAQKMCKVMDMAIDAKKPNIVFMLVDNLGYGELGCYGGGVLRGAPTPHPAANNGG